MSTQIQKSFLNKNTTLPNSIKIPENSKSLHLNFTWTICEKKPTLLDQLFTPWKRVRVKELRSCPFQVLDVHYLCLPLAWDSDVTSLNVWKLPHYPESTRVSETLHEGIPSSFSNTALECYWCWALLSVLSQRHLPCTCCNPISIHS